MRGWSTLTTSPEITEKEDLVKVSIIISGILKREAGVVIFSLKGVQV